MRTGWLVGAIIVFGFGCTRAKDGPSGLGHDAGPADGDAGVTTEAQPTLTDDRLLSYIRYQRAMVDVYDSLFRELERLGGRTDGGPEGIPPQVAVVEAKAQAEERARTDAGLTAAEVDWIEPMVLDVLNARGLARSLDATDQLEELTAMRDQLQGEAREGLDQTIQDLRLEQEQALRLSDVREKYGDRNVDAVLRHEQALSENHQLWLSKISGGRR